MFKIIFLLVLIVLVDGGFFDLIDVDDPFALLWNMPTVQHKFSDCKIDNTRSGVCMEKTKCLLTGGTPNGKCGIIFTCCSYEEHCVKTSDKKKSSFEVNNLNSAITNCKYTIQLRNKNVCQVRLDFEQLVLAPAIQTISSTEPNANNIFTCANDELRITPNYYGVPNFCGTNTNQHVYIHINQNTDTNKAINIDINLANRLSEENQHLPKPTWKIKFTQLECPLKKNKFDIFKYKDFDDIANDFNSLAPQGVIQYFTEPKGEIKSFGFNMPQAKTIEEMTSYPYPQHYAIAFRRPSDVCGIKFTPLTLNLQRTSSGSESACDHYLSMPEYFATATNTLDEDINGVCSATPEDILYSFPPGPLYLNFKAIKTNVDITETINNQGFNLNYEVLTTCPNKP